MLLALKNRVNRIVPMKYFLIGMIIGLLFGILVIIPLASNDASFFKFGNNQEYFIGVREDENEERHIISVNTTLAGQLYNKVKVLCWILTCPKNHKTRAKHVKATWGKRCDYLLFMSTEEDPSLPSIALPVKEHRVNLWGKTKEAFKYVYNNYYDKADWFFKADDDTYAVMENMRDMLHFHNTSDPVYFGFRFKPLVKQGYMAGGSGYVLSKEALKRFIKDSLPNPGKCNQGAGAEDVEIGKCLQAVGVKAGDSRDKGGHSTFLPLYADNFLQPGKLSKGSWFWRYTYYPLETGLNCCSDNLISVHYVGPENMYLLEYLIYHVKLFGLTQNSTFDSIIKRFGDNSNATNKKRSVTHMKAHNISTGTPDTITRNPNWDDYT